MGRSKLSDSALKQMILFAGVVSYFLGKAALNGEQSPQQAAENDPVVRALRQAAAA